MPWIKIRKGEYRNEEGYEVAALPATDDDGVELAGDEWFAYDPDGNMLDAFPTMREARAACEQ